MKHLFHAIKAKLTGKNSVNTPISVIQDQLFQSRAIPIGRQEFDEWSDRIIAGTMLPATPDSQKFALAEMIMHLGPQETHKPDAFFINQLRKSAANQIAYARMQELREETKARLAAAEKGANEMDKPTVQSTAK